MYTDCNTFLGYCCYSFGIYNKRLSILIQHCNAILLNNSFVKEDEE